MFVQEQIKLFGYAPAGNINPVGIYTWNTGSLTWEKQIPITGGGGGGGPVTVADGADVAQGATTDAAVITDTTGTLSGKLRGLVKWAFERMPASLGQKTMAASLPVTLASDQSALNVTGPLTDAQLRASAVPVSGAFFQATQPVSIAATVAISAAALPLPANAAIEAGGNLAAILARTPALGSALSAASSPVVIASDQIVPVSSSTLAAESGGNLASLNLLAQTKILDTLAAMVMELRITNHLLKTGLNSPDEIDALRIDNYFNATLN